MIQRFNTCCTLFFVALIVLIICPFPGVAQTIVINEYLASNVHGIPDKDGDNPDWIELLNTGIDPVELGGWHISDDPENPLLWTFPHHQLPPGERLLIYASGKDRRYLPAVWETVIDRGDIWSYTTDTCEQGESWIEVGFDDSGWSQGPTGIGYGDDDDETVIEYTKVVYIRHTFQLEDPTSVSGLAFHIDYDDAFVAYINGVEIARKNIGLTGIPPDCRELAISTHEAEIYDGGLPTCFSVEAPTMLLTGANVLAIEGHNLTHYSSDLSLIPWLTLGLDTAPIGGGDGLAEYLRFILPHLHTSFGLSNGETVTLRDSEGMPVDEVYTGIGWTDISRGRAPDGAGEWSLFTEPTPDAPNPDEGYAEFAAKPFYSESGGFHTAPIMLEIYSPVPGVEIRFTTDGSDPHQLSTLYDRTISILATRIIRARCFETGKLPSSIATASFLFGVETELPVISLVTDPDNLWDWETGIYVLGPNANPGSPYYGANFWQDWEKQAHIEFFETDGTTPIAQDLGIKIHGGTTRALPQKSLRLIARGGYGTSRFDHHLFSDLELDSFKTLILRNAGNDWCRAHLRDGFMHTMGTGPQTDRQAYRPVLLYLNGEYWGIHNLRERLDDNYLADHHGIDPQAVVILEDKYREVEGDNQSYLDMLDWIEQHDLTPPAAYDSLDRMIDLANFAIYNIFEIYFANTDWPYGNTRFWRPEEAGGRWRWMFKDLDGGLGNWDGVEHNTLAHALAEDGGSTNPPWSTFLLRSLMGNSLFKRDFINSYAEMMSRPLTTATLTERFNGMAENIEGEIPHHFERWGGDYGYWFGYTGDIRDWILQRSVIAKQHMLHQFGLPDTVIVTMSVAPPGAGRLQLTATEVCSLHSVCYFEGNEVPVTANPKPGWVFDHWSGLALPDTSSVVIDPVGEVTLIAQFSEAPTDSAAAVINEINYNSADNFDPGDWIEFHNPGTVDLDLTGWSFRDSDDSHIFHFPRGTNLAADGYLLLCRELDNFTALFPDAGPVLGEMDFGFSGGGELLRLFDGDGELYDLVEYDDQPPWPTEPDGGGATLELKNHTMDNSLPESWSGSMGHGTPGERNSVFEATSSPIPTVPAALTLDHPWPNPFNPTTSIRFATPNAGWVKLVIYDPRGRLVERLIHRKLEAGIHQVTWQAGDLSSGIYLVRLEAGGESRSGKLLLLK